jgi:hypothetical protein
MIVHAKFHEMLDLLFTSLSVKTMLPVIKKKTLKCNEEKSFLQAFGQNRVYFNL